MCLLKVKEEPYYSEPVRVKQIRRTTRTYSPERVTTARYSKARVVEERRPSNYNLPQPEPIPAPPPPPSYFAGPPPDPPAPPPAPPIVNSEHVSIKRTESRRTSRAPSAHQSAIIVETEPQSPTRAPSAQSPTHASYIEVSHEAESPPSSAPSSNDEVRSHSTRRTSNTHKSATTKRSSLSSPKSPAARSEYSEHEKEYRRERAFSGGRRQPEYETYQYVNAPSGYDRRASKGSFGYRNSNEGQIVQRDYWR